MSIAARARCTLLALTVLLVGAAGAAEPRLRWFDANGQASSLGREAAAILAAAAADGLDPADYVVSAADGDAALQDTFLRYLRHLRLGRVRSKDLGFRVDNGARTEQDIAARLQAAVDAGRLQPVVGEMAPPLAQYRQLREALARYRGLAAGPAFAALPPVAKKLVPGEPYAGTAALRERLLAFGDLGADVAVSSTHYDQALAEAVRRFQARHGLEVDGVVGRSTFAALNVAPARRVRQIELAMERLRWLPLRSGRPFVAINIPMFRLWAWDAGAAEPAPTLSMGVIVGRAMRTSTPVFADEMTHLIFRPYWNVPRSILRNEVLPAVERDSSWLARHDMEVVSGQGDDAKPVGLSAQSLDALRSGALRVRQRPGPKNSLGLVKFIFPNDDNVYLHGTPATSLFARSRRDFSHGCVRVEQPTALAQWLLKDQPAWTAERIAAAMDADRPQQVNLVAPVPVILYYITAAVTPDDGLLHFADDIYGHDAALERALARGRAR
ncbi:L,D-transpeptidase family protein [uncultured Piscinibacter sp.]|uniref:L,D-transpeptidase family protein n=1 Tax=uncultured Piscinibacter sp. TaxID=1131835 RepID=UPI00260CE42F|nr:L,D-transpeptidase family protein [uncultured Piscinibacter sp.]